MKKKKNDSSKLSFIVSLFLLPIAFSFFIIVLNNYEKFDSLFKTCTLIALLTIFIVFILSLRTVTQRGTLFKKSNLFSKIVCSLFVLVYVTGIPSVVNYVYFNEDFKNWLITTSFASINHKSVADSLYSKYTIDEVLKSNVESEEDLIDFDVQYDTNYYANEYEKEIFSNNNGEIYKVIKITGTTSSSGLPYVAYMAIVFDPSHVKLAKSSGAGTFEGSYGETLSTIARKNNALLAINAGGFYDPDWNSNGGIPHGDVFIDGQLDSTYTRSDFGGGIIGFDYNNKLILKRMSTEEAIEMGIRDAVDWGPFLIVDGVNRFKDSYSSWECGRTAIGQRSDGIVLLLVVDGLQEHSKGASYRDLADIMEKYGAVNASNLDGGTSTSMYENGEYVNSPWNGFKPTFRWFPNAWIVVE